MKFYVYNENTGVIVRTGDAGNLRTVSLQAKAGERAVVGKADQRRHRVVNGALVDYQPDKPSPDHVWNDSRWRWELSKEFRERRSIALHTQKQIGILESSQLRTMREMILDPSSEAASKLRLRDIDRQIADLRKDLKP